MAEAGLAKIPEAHDSAGEFKRVLRLLQGFGVQASETGNGLGNREIAPETCRVEPDPHCLQRLGLLFPVFKNSRCFFHHSKGEFTPVGKGIIQSFT